MKKTEFGRMDVWGDRRGKENDGDRVRRDGGVGERFE